MLDFTDYFIIALLMYFAVFTAGLSLIGAVYKLGMKRLNVVFKNDVPHLVDSMTDQVLKKVINKTKTMNARRAKDLKAQGPAPGAGGWMGVIGPILQSPAGQQMIGNFISNMTGPKPPPKTGASPTM